MGTMRTEHDLREALLTLERHAPDRDAVLRAVRAGSGPPRTRPGRDARRPFSPRLIVPIAAGAAAAGLAIALLPGAARPGGASRPAPPALPTTGSVAKAMLTAYDAVAGDVEYEVQTGAVNGATTDVYQIWSWPAQAVPGQRQVIRTLYRGISPSSSTVKLTEDRSVEFVTPAASATTARDQITMVCFLGSGQTGCGFDKVNTPPGMWSRFTAQVRFVTDVGADGYLNPATLARGVADGAWRIVRRTRLDGQQAIELSETGHHSRYVIEPLPTLLWVNAQTYLPIRLVSGTGNGYEGMATVNFSFLPATEANLALLRVPIPAGYQRYVPKR